LKLLALRDCSCGALQVEKEKDALRLELNKAKTQIAEAETAITGQKAQLEKLNHVVAEADAGGGM
jgi:chromosome segregation ATPase